MLLQRTLTACVSICLGASLGCSKQRSITADLDRRVEKQLRAFYNLRPDVKVSLKPLRPSEFPNYDTLIITLESSSRKQDYEFLLSKDQKTLVRFAKLDLSNARNANVAKAIDLRGRPVRGKKNAKVVVVVWNDFECPFCSQMHRALFGDVLKKYGDRVAFVYKDFPLDEIHPWAVHAAVDANCLGAQSADAYWAFADRIDTSQAVVNSEHEHDGQFAVLDRFALLEAKNHKLDITDVESCIASQKDDRVRASISEGLALGVEATPTLFVNGYKVEGIRSVAELELMLDKALDQSGTPPPAANATRAAVASSSF
jgi:protein-disulfide isomerase